MRMFLLVLVQCLLYKYTDSASIIDYYNLITNVNEQNYDNTVNIVKQLQKSKDSMPTALPATIIVLTQCSIKNMLQFAYRLWEADEKKFVKDYFPGIFKIVLNQNNVRIVNYKYNMPLKLDANTDYDGDRLVWGSDNKNYESRLTWTLNPVWEENRVYFTIKNVERQMHLKLNYKPDDIGDRKVWGDNRNVSLHRLTWSLEPQWKNGDLVFHIINQEYGSALKLAVGTDSYNDRQAWGHKGCVSDDPDRYLWQILVLK